MYRDRWMQLESNDEGVVVSDDEYSFVNIKPPISEQ
jgi:biopolymer transport protein ExbB